MGRQAFSGEMALHQAPPSVRVCACVRVRVRVRVHASMCICVPCVRFV